MYLTTINIPYKYNVNNTDRTIITKYPFTKIAFIIR